MNLKNTFEKTRDLFRDGLPGEQAKLALVREERKHITKEMPAVLKVNYNNVERVRKIGFLPVEAAQAVKQDAYDQVTTTDFPAIKPPTDLQ